ncbi:hypothetical protein PG996_012864 [Apiospora saccharicola]|uniref:Uncharacterized protein n=1 Tax=Apiospora saccharicola TaxID=335842 RepID=A0ABR1U3T5_9PEZI
MSSDTSGNVGKEVQVDESPEQVSLADEDGEGSTEPTSPCTPYRPFPRVMNFYSQMSLSGLKYAHLCGDTKEDQLFVFGVHTGYSGNTPLGTRPGLILYNGLSHKDPILAGACDESQWAARVYAFNLKSVILLPPVEAVQSSKEMVSELMTTTSNDEGGVSYFFTIEAGQGDKMERKRFEWRQFKKGDQGGVEKDGFKLLSRKSHPDALGESSTSPSTAAAAAAVTAESSPSGALAMLTWAKLGSKINHPLSLEFADDTVSVLFGERWTLMVVITALRLWALRTNGRGKKSTVAIAEKIRGKSAT